MKSFKNEYIDLIMSKLPDILVALVVLIIFWIIAKLLKTTILKILNTHTNSSIPNVIGSIIKKVIIFDIFEDNKLPLMMSMINTICDEKPLNIQWKKFKSICYR